MLTNQLEVYSSVAELYGIENPLHKGDRVVFAASKNENLDIVNYYQADVIGFHGKDATIIHIENITLINYKPSDNIELKTSPDTSITGDGKSHIFSSHILETLN
ncbi:TPA: hypothetical protein SD378_002112 [Morganella morganii]|nr:hypothetical protein [Morganella morganii]